MKKYHIKANKNLGQNFLIDEQVIEKIVNASEITKAVSYTHLDVYKRQM